MADRFQDAFRRAATDQSATAPVAATYSEAYIDRVEAAIDHAEEQIVSISANAKAVSFAKGDAAEAWHAGTANIDAVRRGHTPEALAPRETIDHGPDIVFGEDRLDPAQLKYYADANSSAKAVAEPGYEDMAKVIPADQLPQARDWLIDRADSLQSTDPGTADLYRNAAETITDRVSHAGSHSTPLTERQSSELVDDARDDGALDLSSLGLTPDQYIEMTDALRVTAGGAAEAAAIAAGIQVAGFVIAAIRRAVDEGSLTAADLEELSQGRAVAVSRSALSGTLAGAITLAAGEGALGDAAQALAPEAISACVVVTINSAILAYRASTGQIGWDAAGYQMAKGGSAVAGAMVGAAIGTAIMPVIGTIVGSIIGGAAVRLTVNQTEHVAMTLAVTNGWTYFGLVAQNYAVPDRVLASLGWDTIEVEAMELETVEVDSVEYERMTLDRTEIDEPIWLMRRGVIGVRTIGYV